ncbi:MAG: hypothetical protein GY870_03445 [archaeon]|nr:hypothetical protein [archaeon]
MENTKPYVQLPKKTGPINHVIKKILDKYLVGFFLSNEAGNIIYERQYSLDINIDLMSNFISALSIFGEENVGKIKRILVEGLNVEINIISKHNLILCVLFKPNMVKDYLNEELEKGIDLFYERFKEQIDSGCTNLSVYREYDDTMAYLIHKYLIRIDAL